MLLVVFLGGEWVGGCLVDHWMTDPEKDYFVFSTFSLLPCSLLPIFLCLVLYYCCFFTLFIVFDLLLLVLLVLCCCCCFSFSLAGSLGDMFSVHAHFFSHFLFSSTSPFVFIFVFCIIMVFVWGDWRRGVKGGENRSRGHWYSICPRC